MIDKGEKLSNNELIKARQAKLKSLHLCISCGKEPLHTKNHCWSCAIRARENNRKYQGSKRRNLRSKSYIPLEHYSI